MLGNLTIVMPVLHLEIPEDEYTGACWELHSNNPPQGDSGCIIGVGLGDSFTVSGECIPRGVDECSLYFPFLFFSACILPIFFAFFQSFFASTYGTNLKTLCTAQKRSVSTLFATAQQPHSRDIFINQKFSLWTN